MALSNDALWLINAVSQEYKYPGWMKNFSNQALHDALEYLETEDLKRTVPRRELIRKEIRRRTTEDRAVLTKLNDTRLPPEFCEEWDRICREIRRRMGY